MIRLDNVTKNFAAAGSAVCAVSAVSLHIPEGRLVHLTGNNGAGKTTLILLMAGLMVPSSGRVYMAGQDISILPEPFMVALRRRKIGMIFQERFLMARASVMDNLMLPMIPCNLPIKTIREKARTLLDELGLEKKSKTQCRFLSGGEKQRLMIARALINDPEIIFADEPFTHLDQDVTALFSARIAAWVDAGKTVIITSHQKEPADLSLPCLHFHMDKGRLREQPS